VDDREPESLHGLRAATAGSLSAKARYFDLWHGVELHPQQEGQQSVLSFEIEDDGYGAILETAATDATLDKLLTTMRPLSQHPLDSFSRAWHTLPQQIVAIAPTKPADTAPPGWSEFRLQVLCFA